jgi:hypothetical protein
MSWQSGGIRREEQPGIAANSFAKDKHIGVRRNLAVELRYEGYPNHGGYKAAARDHAAHGWPGRHASASLLGVSEQGRLASDIWRAMFESGSQEQYLRYKGSVSRGILVLGFVEAGASQSSKERNQVPYGQYDLHGSTFLTRPILAESCFKLPLNHELVFFAGVVQDLYSLPYTSFEIQDISISNDPCPPSGSGALMATL